MLDYEALTEEAINGGFTVAIDGAHPVKGFAVGTRPDSEHAIRLTPQTSRSDVADAIYAYVVHHGFDLREGYQLGAWRDGDTIVLDLVNVLERQDTAEILAGWISPDATIYDLAARETIELR